MGLEAEGLIDLDTMSYGTLDAELGDALRSWCNTAREDDPSPCFSLPLFRAAMEGYLHGSELWLTAAERASIPAGIRRIVLELAARFAADALNESYFGFDLNVAPTRGDHNLIRAKNQLCLARIVAEKQGLMGDTIGEIARSLTGTPAPL